jgi:glycosyltransferase
MTSHNYQLKSISEADSGIYDAINKGIKLATGDVIGLLHSDDSYADEDVIRKYAFAFDQSTTNNQPQTIDAVYSDLVYVSKKQEVKSEKSEITNYQLPANYNAIRYWKAHKTVNSNQSSVSSKQSSAKSKNTDHYLLVTDHLLKNGWMPPHPTLFIRKEIFDKYSLYNTDLKIASDYEMILRLFYKYKINSCYLPFTTYLMSIGGASNKNIKNILQKSKEDFRAMKMNGIPCPLFTLANKNLRKLPQFLVRS